MTIGNRLLKYPGTWLVLAMTVGFQTGVWWWFSPSLLVSVGFAVLGVILLAIWPPLYATSTANLAAITSAQQRIDVATIDKIQQLEQQLRKLDADQAVAQLRGLREKLQSVTAVVEARLNAGELAFARYLGTAEQVYLAAVDNLQQVAISMTSVGSININQIDQRLPKVDVNRSAGAQEQASLLERRALAVSQNDKIAQLLAQNETAMTSLANMAAALADVRTTKGYADLDPDTAMAELELLAKRAKKFDVSQ